MANRNQTLSPDQLALKPQLSRSPSFAKKMPGADTVDERLFDMFRDEPTDQTISAGKFLQGLQETGLRKNDPRLKTLMSKLKKLEAQKEAYNGLQLTREEFAECVRWVCLVGSKTDTGWHR